MKCPVNRLTLALGLLAAATAVGPAVAHAAPSENATVNLIRLLVEQGVLKQDKADALIAQAEREAQ
ncbi:putative porin, partial [Pseudomonas entomophila]